MNIQYRCPKMGYLYFLSKSSLEKERVYYEKNYFIFNSLHYDISAVGLRK